MAVQQWLITVLVVGAVFHGLAIIYAYWLARTYANSRDAEDASDQTTQAQQVACPACGAANERGYRYCRECVAELPGARKFGENATAPTGRWLS